MSEETKPDTQGAGADPDAGAEQTQQAHTDLAKHLSAPAEGSSESSSDSGQKGAEEGGKATSKAPTLTKVQSEAARAVGLTDEKVLEMGDEGVALVNKLVTQRTTLSNANREAGQNLKALEELRATIKAAESKGDAASQKDLIGEDEYGLDDETRTKINKNFRAQGKEIFDLKETVDKLKAGAAETIDGDGVRDRNEFFEQLGPEWTQFGEGPSDGLEEYSPEAINRNAVLDLAAKLVKTAGLDPAQARETALMSLYKEQHTNAAVRSTLKANDEKEAGSVEAPSGGTRQQSVADATNAAHAELAKNLAQHNA